MLDKVKVAVIGAGSIVTHDVPAYGVALGVPAKVVADTRDSEGAKPLQDSRSSDFNMMPSLFTMLHGEREAKDGKQC